MQVPKLSSNGKTRRTSLLSWRVKFKISLGTYNACYNRAVREPKNLNPTKTTIPKKIIGNEIVKHMAESKEAGKGRVRYAER